MTQRRTASPTASLGMYDLPWLQGATDMFWAAVRDHLRAAGLDGVPATLDRDRPLAEIWRDPNLLLAQTCGLPLITTLRATVRLVATPCYDLPGCDGPYYCSFIVVAADNDAAGIEDLRGSRAVINDWESQSGMKALRAAILPFADFPEFFSNVRVSGSHWRSLAAVQAGSADIAAIDCVTYGLLGEHLTGTRILQRTRSTPGLPLVTAAATPDATLAMLVAALTDAMTQPNLAPARAALHLSGLVRLSLGEYGGE